MRAHFAGAGGFALAAVLHGPDSPEPDALDRFAGDLERRGWPVCRATAEEVRAGKAPGDGDPTGVLVVDGYAGGAGGDEGLSRALLGAAGAGVPTLVAVPAADLEAWRRLCRGRGDLLASDLDALWGWWGPGRLLDELVLGVDDGEVTGVVLGRNWTLVAGPDGAGVARSPSPEAPGVRRMQDAGALTGRSLADLARLARSWNPVETAVGIAAVNAHHNRFAGEGSDENGLDAFAGLAGPVTVVGRFPGVEARLPGCRVVERAPLSGEYPEVAAPELLAGSEAAVITASTLANRTLPGLLAASRGVRVALVGPGTPLAPGLHRYGVEILSGLVITDPSGAARAVAEGGGERALRAHGRFLTLRGAPPAR